MAAELRFHLDESVASAVAEGLRRRGIDVTTSQEADLLSADDTVQLEFARRQGRVLITQDSDFLRLAQEGAGHAGVAYYLAGSRSIGQLVSLLVLLHALVSAGEMEGRVEFL